MAENILHDYAEQLAAVTLVPGSGGVFDVSVGDRQIFSKERLGRFPQENEVESSLEKELEG